MCCIKRQAEAAWPAYTEFQTLSSFFECVQMISTYKRQVIYNPLLMNYPVNPRRKARRC